MLDWLGKLGVEIWAAIGLAALIGGWLRGWLQWVLPFSYGQVWRFLCFRRVELYRWPVVTALPDHVMVVVCCLDGDDIKDSDQRVLARTLSDPSLKLQVVLDWRRLSIRGADHLAATGDARQRANEIRLAYFAPVVVWGEVAAPGGGLCLNFQGANSTVRRDMRIDRGLVEEASRDPLGSIMSALTAAAALQQISTAGYAKS
jgi:hypothetical protein